MRVSLGWKEQRTSKPLADLEAGEREDELRAELDVSPDSSIG